MFSNPKKVVDRWVGNQPINLHNGIIDTVSYTFAVTSEKLEKKQIDKAMKILDQYAILWKSISPKLKWKNFDSRLLLFMPAVVGEKQFEFMFGYECLQNGTLKSAFFAFNGEEISYVHIDH